jgi:uncharacterized RDD family membrane protein YckC
MLAATAMNYHIARKGQQLGVFTADAVARKLATGDLDGTDLAWTDGMTEWQPIHSIVEITAAVAASPPPMVESPTFSGSFGASDPFAPAPVAADLATPMQRLAASLLDGLVSLPAVIPLVLAMAPLEDSDVAPTLTGSQWTWLAVAVVWLLAVMVINLVMLTKRGQTIGKKWMGIRIARVEDDGNPGFVKAVLLRGFVNGLIGSIPLIGPVYSLVDICFIFREDRRCIHDHIAGTRVVKV